MDPIFEQKLVRAAQDGDRKGVGQLFDAYADKIFRYLYARLDDLETAEALTGQVFLNFVEALTTHEIDNIPPVAWLYKVAHARLTDFQRHHTHIGEAPN